MDGKRKRVSLNGRWRARSRGVGSRQGECTLTIAVHPAAMAPRRGTRRRVIGSKRTNRVNDQLPFEDLTFA